MRPEWVEKARELRASGLTYRRVAELIGESRNRVYYWLRLQDLGEPQWCETCGREFNAYSSTRSRFCSRKCWAANPPGRSPEGTERVRREMRKRGGRKNPNYRHGRRVGERPIARVFNLELKGDRVCRSCGKEARHAHHAVPRSLAPQGRRDLRNCLPLCASCHTRWHRGSPIPRHRFTAEEWAYVETLVGPDWLDRRYPDEGAAFLESPSAAMFGDQRTTN